MSQVDGRDNTFEIGRLHGRVQALETRADKQEAVLTGIDSKIDSVLLVLASARGGDEKAASLVKLGLALIAALGSVGGIIAAAIHFIATGVSHGG